MSTNKIAELPGIQFFPYDLEYNCGDFAFRLDDAFEKTVESIDRLGCVSEGWLNLPTTNYDRFGPAPLHRSRLIDHTARIGSAHSLSLRPSHRIVASYGISPKLLRGLALVFGFATGMYLLPGGYSFLHKIPANRSTLGDLLINDRDVVEVLSEFKRYLDRASSTEADLLVGSIATLLRTECRSFSYERFLGAYIALEGCAKLAAMSQGKIKLAASHAELPAALCDYASIPVPIGAQASILVAAGSKRKTCKYALLRNEMIHEALHDSEPLGFQHSLEMLDASIEICGIVRRSIFKILGLDSDQISSPVDTKMSFLFELRS